MTVVFLEQLCAHNIIQINPNIPIENQITQEDGFYQISEICDLQGKTVQLPKNCILSFNGGKLVNGVIVYDNTTIIGQPNIDCTCYGTISNEIIDVCFYGAQLNGKNDSEAFQNAINYAPNNSIIYMPYGRSMVIGSQVIISKDINLEMNGTILLIHNGRLSFGTKEQIIELNEFKFGKIIGDGPQGNCIAIDMVNARFNTFNILGIGNVKYAISFNLDEFSKSIGQNIFNFNRIYNCDKGIYFHGFSSFVETVWSEGNQFMGGFLGKCNVGLEFERNLIAGCTIYRGCIDCMEIENSFDIIDKSNTDIYHMPNMYLCNFVRRKNCILPKQSTMIETQSGIVTQGFITSRSGLECSNGISSTYIGAGSIEITDDHPFIDFKTDFRKDRDSRLISTEDSLTIEVGHNVRNRTYSTTIKK